MRFLSGLNRFFRVVYGAGHRPLSPQKSHLEVEFLIFRNFQKVKKSAILDFFEKNFEKIFPLFEVKFFQKIFFEIFTLKT